MSVGVLICDECEERYDDLQLVADEPCPKLRCVGSLLVEVAPIPTQGGRNED